MNYRDQQIPHRGPYIPPLKRLASCTCYVLPMKEVLNMNRAAVKCGVDLRTVRRDIGQHLYELNTMIDKECGKMVVEKCAKQGFEIIKTLGGALRGGGKVAVSGWSLKERLDAEEQGACVAEPELKVDRRWQNFLPLSFNEETSLEPELLSSQTKVYSRFRPNKGGWLPPVV